MSSTHSRFEAVSRRAFVKRSLALGALVVTPGLACSKSDQQAFSASAATDDGAAASSTAAVPTTTPVSANSSTSPTTVTAVTAGRDTTTAATSAFPSGGQLVINFTFTAPSGGQVHSPYIAVWIEDAAGEMVKTVSLWYKSRESKYLNELTRWATVESAFENEGKTDPVDTVSGATRVAGAYTVAWDGTDVDGAAVAQGDYFVCIEAAREHGPYELIRGAVTIGGTASTTPLDDNGELSAASAELVV